MTINAEQHARPTSPFPYAALTDVEARARREASQGVLTLHVLFPNPDEDLQRRTLAARRHAADLLRSTNVRCGYQRKGWSA